MVESRKVTPDIDVLSTFFQIPVYGLLPVNAFVIKGREPVLVDTGIPLDDKGADDTASFMAALRKSIDPADIRWIFLTHADMDHVASLHQILDEAPKARVITTFLTVGRMSVFHPLPLNRLYLMNPGQSLNVGDRTLVSVKPPSYDAADTSGVFVPELSAYFSADCFGAVLPEPAYAAADIPPDVLKQGKTLWSTIDAPWLHSVDPAKFGASLNGIRGLGAEWILGAHLPPARGMCGHLLDTLAEVPAAMPFIGPDQKALEQMLGGNA